MEQIIQSISQKLGLPEAVVRSGVTVLLNLLKDKTKGTQYEAFISMIPGAQTVANSPMPEPKAGGGLLGGLLGAAGSLLGGQAGELAKAASSLQSAGIEPEKVAPFVETFFQEAKTQAGPEKVDELLASLPGLQDILKHMGKS